MRRFLSVLITVLVLTFSLEAQQANTSSPTPSSANHDMGKTQDEIRDCIAYQLFFKTLAVPAEAGTEDLREQRTALAAIGLGAADEKVLVETVASFHERYTALRDSYDKEGKYDTAHTIAHTEQVDSLVDTSRNALKGKLSPAGMKRIDAIIKGDESLRTRAEQYARWRGLRKLQLENEKKESEKKTSGESAPPGPR
jgi:hypothetical protein